MRQLSRLAAIAALVALGGCVGQAAPGPGVYAPGYGQPPGYAPPPGSVPPPGYAPPTAYAPPGYAPQGYPQQGGYAEQPGGYGPAAAAAYGSTCYAGVYTCALPQALPVGAQCSCPGLGAPSFGNVH